jgi:ubiquinone/menaquinone biosynthesis C-methylase UbiE
LAFSYRDFTAELDAVIAWATESAGRPPATALELAAGPGDHVLGLAQRGLVVTGLDLSAQMCDRMRERADDLSVELDVVQADMRSFELGRTFDLAITMLDSTTYLLTLDDMLSYLDSVARHLSPGGSLIVEMSHPRDAFDADATTSSDWTMSSGDEHVHIRWGSPDGTPDDFDATTQVTQTRVSIDYSAGNGSSVAVTETHPSRAWTATEFEAAIRLSGEFDVVRQFGSFSGVALNSPEAWRMITVLRRR